MTLPGLDPGHVRVRTFTSWVASGEHSVPRELVIDVRGRAPSLDEAVTMFANIARPIATIAGFVANVRVGPAHVHLAYDCTADHHEREFLEAFLPDEQGGVAEGRMIRQHLMMPACSAFFRLGVNRARVDRALRQYELALREWYVGGEWLALGHLYIAVETLTKAMTRKMTADRSISEEELAQSLGVVTVDSERSGWVGDLHTSVRKEIIFAGDTDTYRTARRASDGLEHGFLKLSEIAQHALKCADKTFLHVRRTILELLELPAEIVDELMSIKPKDVQSRRKVLRGRLIGAVEDPAPVGEPYPRLEWRSEIASIVQEGPAFTLSEKDQITVRTHPAVGFQLTRAELHGRLEDGQAPVEMSEQDIRIEPTPGSKSADLLASVMPLVNAATASGADAGHTLPRVHAFKLFSQGVAFFQSAHTLIGAHQPVEALLSIQGLTTIAARFEQLTQPSGPGVGVVLRLLLDSVDTAGADAVRVAEHRDALLNAAAKSGITVPDALPAPETTTVWRSLTVEMQLARDVGTAGFVAVARHIEHSDAEHWDFRIRLAPSPFTDLIASACVIAQLRLLQRAAGFFSWTIEAEKVDELLARAQELNDASANPEEEDPSD